MTINYFWNKIDKAVDALALKLQFLDLEKYTLYSLARGGMVPTRLLSGRLGIKKVNMITDYDLSPFIPIEDDAIIVDDIFDTGVTYARFAQKFNKEHLIFAFLFIRHSAVQSKPLLNNVVYGHIVYENDYVVFPWEVSADD